MNTLPRRLTPRVSRPLQQSLQNRTFVSSTKSPQSDIRAILQQLGLLARFGAVAYVIQVYIGSTTMVCHFNHSARYLN